MRLLWAVSLAIVLAGLTAARVSVWQSDRTVWCDAVRRLPTKPRPLNNCALALLREGHADRALPLLDRAAIAVEQREPNRRAALRMAVQSNRLVALVALQRRMEAQQVLSTLDPSDPRTRLFQTWFTAAP